METVLALEDCVLAIYEKMPLLTTKINWAAPSKGMRALMAQKIAAEIAARTVLLTSLLPAHLFAMVPVRWLMDATMVSCPARWIGPTDYIDAIGRRDLAQPVSVGRDPYGRAFVALSSELGVVTLFQRYTGGCTWVLGTRLHGSGMRCLDIGTSKLDAFFDCKTEDQWRRLID